MSNTSTQVSAATKSVPLAWGQSSSGPGGSNGDGSLIDVAQPPSSSNSSSPSAAALLNNNNNNNHKMPVIGKDENGGLGHGHGHAPGYGRGQWHQRWGPGSSTAVGNVGVPANGL